MAWKWLQRSEHSGIVRCRSTALVHACSRGCLGVSGRAKASATKAEETALLLGFVSRFCCVKIYCFGGFWSRNALPSVICVTKLLYVVGNLYHVFGAPTLYNHLSLLPKSATRVQVTPLRLERKQFTTKIDDYGWLPMMIT